MTTFLAFETHDVRFPTSRMLDGSDAMNPDPDYSAAPLPVPGMAR
jgi:L-fuconate dehydratase